MTDKVVFAATPADDYGIAQARQWLRLQGLSSDDARLVKRDGQVLVILRPGASVLLRSVSGEEDGAT